MAAAWHRLVARARAVWQRDALDDEFAEELAADLDLRISEYERRGLSPTDARRQARRDLDGVTGLRDAHRATGGIALLEHAGRDLRASLRSLAAAPVFTTFAVVTLALGLGASAAVYSLVHALLVRPLPFAEPDRLVWVANVADDLRSAPGRHWSARSAPLRRDAPVPVRAVQRPAVSPAPPDAPSRSRVAAGLIVVAVLAAYLPARAAARVTPLDALRSE